MGGLAPHVRAAIAAAMQPRMAEAQRVGARPGPPRGQSVGLQAKPATRILPPTALRWHANLHPNAVQLAQEQEEPEIVQYVEVASTNPSHPFDCAEPHAVATLASLGVALENICVRGISTVPTNKAEQGETRTPCKNCSEWLELVVDGVYRIKPAKLKASWRSGYRIGMGRISGQHLAYQLGLD